VFAGDPERIHWSFEDPATIVGTDDEKQLAFDATAKQLLTRIRLWLQMPAVRIRLEQAASAPG
jgi:arsenate reductase